MPKKEEQLVVPVNSTLADFPLGKLPVVDKEVAVVNDEVKPEEEPEEPEESESEETEPDETESAEAKHPTKNQNRDYLDLISFAHIAHVAENVVIPDVHDTIRVSLDSYRRNRGSEPKGIHNEYRMLNERQRENLPIGQFAEANRILQ